MSKGVNDDKINTMKINGREEIMTHLSLGFSTSRATLGDHPKPRWGGGGLKIVPGYKKELGLLIPEG